MSSEKNNVEHHSDTQKLAKEPNPISDSVENDALNERENMLNELAVYAKLLDELKRSIASVKYELSSSIVQFDPIRKELFSMVEEVKEVEKP